MSIALLSVREAVPEQGERARQTADMERFMGQSEYQIASPSLEYQISSLDDRESLICSIRTLPVEMLAAIFEFAIRDHIRNAFRISQVCSDWRQVVHGTPQLWTGPIEVDLEGKIGHQTRAYADGLKAWLVRSAPLLITLTLELGGRLGNTMINHRILEEVLTTGPRWRSLKIRLGTFDVPSGRSLLSRLAECRLDNLEELDMGTLSTIDRRHRLDRRS
ncbi:hypothetical protein K438DRAFT_274468 [Mycena galopus ATCC 62051]|nr:hypothetical protein K438DRAFT_274468 [Mycena galopus ATCC 62051]